MVACFTHGAVPGRPVQPCFPSGSGMCDWTRFVPLRPACSSQIRKNFLIGISLGLEALRVLNRLSGDRRLKRCGDVASAGQQPEVT